MVRRSKTVVYINISPFVAEIFTLNILCFSRVLAKTLQSNYGFTSSMLGIVCTEFLRVLTKALVWGFPECVWIVWIV